MSVGMAMKKRQGVGGTVLLRVIARRGKCVLWTKSFVRVCTRKRARRLGTKKAVGHNR